MIQILSLYQSQTNITSSEPVHGFSTLPKKVVPHYYILCRATLSVHDKSHPFACVERLFSQVSNVLIEKHKFFIG